MITEGNIITKTITQESEQPTKTQAIHKKNLFKMGLVAMLMVSMFVTPGAAAINTTEITQAMTDIATIIDSLSSVWSALVSMIVGIMPLMIVLAIITFVMGLFAVILGKIKDGGGFGGNN